MTRGRSPRVADCHPDAKHRAKGLCGPCYYRAYRGEKQKSGSYADILEEELDHYIRDWVSLEREYNRTRKQMTSVLLKRKRQDLIEAIQAKTYGVVGKSAIISVTRRRKIESDRM